MLENIADNNRDNTTLSARRSLFSTASEVAVSRRKLRPFAFSAGSRSPAPNFSGNAYDDWMSTFERWAAAGLRIAGDGDTGSMRETAELTEAVFKLRMTAAGRVDADFVLTLITPQGVQHWDFGWNLRDVLLEPARGRSLREQFSPFMRSLFDDHSVRPR